ncbi:MBL fold metallo-hydrolase [Marinospirillum sp.]|uniref:MBL fold metallo-hydrolase n=1 Tax=Marinospirillum sp. TaxID=2183934 RepID=UPI003A8AE0B3
MSTPAPLAPLIQPFFDQDTFTYSYLVRDPASSACAIIDSVLDFDPASGRTQTQSADQLIAAVTAQGLTLEWILETHVHADHLSAAPYLQQQLGGQIVIGAKITEVQRVFADVFHAEPEFARDGSQFDRLVEEGDCLPLGELSIQVLHTPGHTPACVTYLIGDAAFVGDTLFMPDYGTARCDFPGGDARQLYQSIHKIFALPDTTRLMLCHDYQAPGRDRFCHETSVAEQKQQNVHVHLGVSEAEFVQQRQAKDATLKMPRLILPSVQVNMRAGQLPPAEANGVRYLKLPLNLLGA